MNLRKYSGWRGITDHLHILLAVSYEPIEGHLACRFNTGEPLIHAGVPERMYQTLITSPFAGSYYRRHIRGKFPCPFAVIAEKHVPTEDGDKRKKKRQAKERLEQVPQFKLESEPQQLTFSEVYGDAEVK